MTITLTQLEATLAALKAQSEANAEEQKNLFMRTAQLQREHQSIEHAVAGGYALLGLLRSRERGAQAQMPLTLVPV